MALVRATFWLFLTLAALPASAQELTKPAELPPSDYRGQQYVDSLGCLFMRAGPPEATVWVPRVTRDGIPLCGNPPSGRRVPIVGEAGAEAAPRPAEPTADSAPDAPGSETISLADSYLVAVGSFSVAENVDRALTRLKALGYPSAQGRLAGSDGPVTVFAGPFSNSETAAKAQSELRGAGFPDAIVIGP